MAALQRVSVRQQNSAMIVVDGGFRTVTSSQACCVVATRRGSCIALPSLWARGRISGRRRRRSWVATAGGEEGPNSEGQEKIDNNSATSVASPGEPKVGAGGKGFGAPPSAVEKKKPSRSSASGSIRRAAPAQPLISASAADPQAQQIETAIVASLVFLFAVIILEGFILAASGFLPEDWDAFAVNSVYPAFTPSVGLFLAIAAGYGLWKYLGGGVGTSSK